MFEITLEFELYCCNDFKKQFLVFYVFDFLRFLVFSKCNTYTMAKTELLHPKNCGAKEAMDFT